jgi:hypothetical protein
VIHLVRVRRRRRRREEEEEEEPSDDGDDHDHDAHPAICPLLRVPVTDAGRVVAALSRQNAAQNEMAARWVRECRLGRYAPAVRRRRLREMLAALPLHPPSPSRRRERR